MENTFANSSDSPENTFNQMTPKFSDSSNSEEVLVFTSFSNVYKVPRSEIYNIHQVLDKVKLEDGEKAIYITGDKNYSGFLIVAFENGKIGKITMKSYSTEFKRKKLLKAFNNEFRLIFIERIDDDIDLVAMSNIKKVVLFNTVLINPVESRTTKGVQVMKQKDGSSMITVKRAEQANLTDPGYYRKSEGLNVVGFYLKKGDEV
jgi:DNA gyrase/topoisomerase IV subunit A